VNKHLYLCHPLVLSSPTLMMHGHMNLKSSQYNVCQQPLSFRGTVQQHADLYPFDFRLWGRLKNSSVFNSN